MKTTMAFSLLLSWTAVAQQSYKNFTIENNTVVFSRVYHTSTDSAKLALQLTDYLQSQGKIKDVDATTSAIYCSLNELPVEGMNRAWTGGNSVWSGRITVLVKDRRYKVTITGLTHSTTVYGYNGSLTAAPVSASIDQILLNQSKTDFEKKKNAVKIADLLNSELEEYFMVRVKKAGDW